MYALGDLQVCRFDFDSFAFPNGKDIMKNFPRFGNSAIRCYPPTSLQTAFAFRRINVAENWKQLTNPVHKKVVCCEGSSLPTT